MANSNQSAVSDGTLALLPVSIDYLERADITVYFNGIPDDLPWAWVGDSDRTISFTPPVPNGYEVQLRRVTNVSKVRHIFSQGAKFTNGTLDENYRQMLLVAQESKEGSQVTDLFNDLDMHGYRILNQLSLGGEGFIWKGTWETGAEYGINNLVYIPTGAQEGSVYIARTTHTAAATFAADLVANRWELFSRRGDQGPGSGDMLSHNNLSDVDDPVVSLGNIGGLPLTGGTLTGALTVPAASYNAGTWPGNHEVPTKDAIAAVYEFLKASRRGTLFLWPFNTPPAGALAIPYSSTTNLVNRSDHPELHALCASYGYPWGIGDGSTTFGIPYVRADGTFVHADGNVATATNGENIAHIHQQTNNGRDLDSGGGGTCGPYTNGSFNGTSVSDSAAYTKTQGGSANLAAGSRGLWCIWT